MAKVNAGMAVNERPLSLAMLVATFLYRSELSQHVSLHYQAFGIDAAIDRRDPFSARVGWQPN